MQSQRWVSTLLLVICVQYFLGTVFLEGVPVIELIWALLLGVLLVFLRPVSFAVIGSVYFTLTLFYTTGVAFDELGIATNVYYRTILTWFIFSALLFGSLKLDLRRLTLWSRSPRLLHGIQFFSIVALSGWALFALRDLNSGELVDFRDVTGAGYLTLSDTFALLSLAYLCRDKLPSWEFVVVVGLSVVVIVLLGSRTTLAFYPFAIAFLIGRHVSFRATLAWSALLGAGAFYWLRDRLDFESGAFFRLNTLFSFSNDESATVRDSIRDQMLARINDNPECLFLACHPEQGWYEHSVLSVVQHFGFAGIFFLLSSVFLGIIRFRYFWRQWYFPIFIYCAVALLLSRAWVSVVFPVFLAFLMDAALASSPRRRKSVEYAGGVGTAVGLRAE
ncbi:MAG: hypothetical protein LCH92_22740 [Proteobacteria bacterium]|nr:hypothetical protein [Pseudomonadota bacterium]